MILINFTHPLTAGQLAQISELSGERVDQVRDVPSQFDHGRSFNQQVTACMNQAGMSSTQWQTESILINPPAYAPAACLLMAELHGRSGYFPACLRLRPVPDSLPPRFEVAEILNLHAVRSEARQRR